MNSSIDLILNRAACPDEAHRDWEALLSSRPGFDAKNYAPAFLRLFGNSRFLTRYILKDPECLKSLEGPVKSAEKLLPQFEREIAQIIKKNPDPLKALKKYKYTELLRITLKDLEGGHDESVLHELSYLAYALLRAVDQTQYEILKNKFGAPTLSDGREPLHHYLALGKMGGFELNYSSDIDIMAITESDQGMAGDISIHEFFVKLTQQLTHVLQEKDEIGFFYRVDWDLRPEGKGGTLVNSLAALEHYYETFGADWERQVFTKASPAAGDLKLGERFIKTLDPFCYRRTFDLESVRRIQGMKERIHDSLMTKRDKGFNVKLHRGGIRDIEFFVQAFLMVFGGVNPKIRSVSTLNIIENLRRERFIGDKTASELTQAYLFLRRLENKLQLVDEEQTHWLSLDPDEMIKVAKRLAYTGSDNEILDRFQADLDQVKKQVSEAFEGLFFEKKGIEAAPPFSLVATDAFAEKSRPHLLKGLSQANDFEQKLEALRIFKKQQFEQISANDSFIAKNRQVILGQLSITAEMIVQEALLFATNELTPKYGLPFHSMNSNQKEPSHFIVLGMGKLGGSEINYYSDLDLIFIYSHNGETNGAKSIPNSEYYARLVQKLISILTVATRQGHAFEVDTELRPSGNSGTLVTSLMSFLEYQTQVSQVWERQSLIRARPIAGSSHLAKIIGEHIDSLLYFKPMPKSIKKGMNQLRTRVIKELAQEKQGYFDYKLGRGSLMDIEYILQYFQLCHGAHVPSLRTRNTFDGLAALINNNLLDESIIQAYSFFRTFESALTLCAKRRIHRLHKESPFLTQIAEKMSVSSAKELVARIIDTQHEVREVYRCVFGLKKKEMQ